MMMMMMMMIRNTVGRESAVGIATRHGMDGPWIESTASYVTPSCDTGAGMLLM